MFLLTVSSHQIILGSSHRNIDGKHLAKDAELPQLPWPRQRSVDALPPQQLRPSGHHPGPRCCPVRPQTAPPGPSICSPFSFPTPLWAKRHQEAPGCNEAALDFSPLLNSGSRECCATSPAVIPKDGLPGEPALLTSTPGTPILMESRSRIPELLRLEGTSRIIHPVPPTAMTGTPCTVPGCWNEGSGYSLSALWQKCSQFVIPRDTELPAATSQGHTVGISAAPQENTFC